DLSRTIRMGLAVNTESAGVGPASMEWAAEPPAIESPPNSPDRPDAGAPPDRDWYASVRAQELRSAKRRILAIAVVLLVILAGWAGLRLFGSGGGPALSGAPLLNEVRFLPRGNESQFVEVKNAGAAPVALGGMTLSNATTSYAIPPSAG